MKSWIADIIDEEILNTLFLHESNDEFVQRVCSICLDEIENKKGYSPMGFGVDVIDEIEIEITEILKIKTYGFFNLQTYRQHTLKKRKTA